MPRYSRRRSPGSIFRIVIIPLFAILCILGLLYENHAFKQQQSTWTTVTALASDTRIRPVARFSLQYGSKPLYKIDVLATYPADSGMQKEWIPLSGAPEPEAKARTDAASLKGKQCLVRWSPSTPDQKIVEALSL